MATRRGDCTVPPDVAIMSPAVATMPPAVVMVPLFVANVPHVVAAAGSGDRAAHRVHLATSLGDHRAARLRC